ncbi:hypothetical protein ACLKMY_39705 [Paraburkholderia mimosarum]|uniref:hypothetical protein n=1 Tax=Paraburkholderia mimosarum TaxID=312026 RepID=UPI000422F35B|nr:hypothetical protein [Paraburkholderia mimosarum]
MPKLGLQLLDLLLMSSGLLFAVLAGSRAEVLEGVTRVHQLFLKRLAKILLFGQSFSLVAHLLRETLDIQIALMQRQARVGMRVLLAGKRGASGCELRLQRGNLGCEPGHPGLCLLALRFRSDRLLLNQRLGETMLQSSAG